jgi:putative spermidine/putrescine transport system ATP-binding protein
VLHVEAATDQGRRLHLKAHEAVRPGDRLRVAVDAERALVFPADLKMQSQAHPEPQAS